MSINEQSRIDRLVHDIYVSTVEHAKIMDETSYKHCLPLSDDGFYAANMATILASLLQHFPICSVTHTLLSRGKDGQLYDISNVDDAMLPLVDTVLNNSYIVIDWS